MARCVPILMYHEITAEPVLSGRLAVPPDTFAQQLGYLKAAGYHTLTAGQFANALAWKAPLPPKPVVLTFDDGFADFYYTALPLMQSLGLAGTLFVTSGWTGASGGYLSEHSPPGMLTGEQIREIADAGIEIGAHSVTHPELDQISAGSLRQELVGGKQALEDLLGVPVPGLAYPFGYSSKAVRDSAAAIGYEYACAVGNRLASTGADRFALPRLTIGRSTRPHSFARTVAAEQLPAEFARLRMMTASWSPVRFTRSALSRSALVRSTLSRLAQPRAAG
ncbi:MAG TPA: polysaccharide deacetylase family protein [Streptosporangiaceae bacterium]|jgi:peptidoglycan/xylan/chitin deacetylase (PgdA/CDA1 family)|nr:polysaccharide deacetylase family protein [Streptosporangiaceae bacterium]